VAVLDAGCCGMAGSFGFERGHYDVSVKVAELSILPALKGAPDALVAAPGTSCRHQVLDLAGRRALHPLEVLAEQLGEDPSADGLRSSERNIVTTFGTAQTT
jgi:Fe-S oxidoreductase